MRTGDTFPPPDVGGEGEEVASLTVTGLTASRLVATDASKTLASVANLASWIAGTASQQTVTDDGDGTITLALATNLYSDGAGKASFRNGTEAQEVRVYKTFISSTNYERFIAIWESDTLFLRTEKGSGGGTDRAMTIGPNGTANLNFQAGGFVRWGVSQSSGTIFPNGDNAYDIGATGGFLPRDVYAGRQFLGADSAGVATVYSFAGATTTGMYHRGGVICFADNGTEIVSIWRGGATPHLYVGSTSGVSWANTAEPSQGGPDLSIYRVSAGVAKVTNGANACEWRVHGNASKYASMTHNGTDVFFSIVGGGGVCGLNISGTGSWALDASAHYRPGTDNGLDFGTTSFRPRTGYFGTSVLIGPSEAGVINPGLGVFHATAAGIAVRETTNDVEGIVYADSTGVIVGSGSNHSFSLRTNNATRLTISAAGTAWTVATATSITLPDACNIVVNATTGTKIGTATTQKIGMWNTAPVVQQVGGVTLVNNVTAGGTTNQLDDFTSLTVYATDAAAIRNNIYQLGRKLKLVTDALRTFGALQNADA